MEDTAPQTRSQRFYPPGLLEVAVLALLKERDGYGYDLLPRVQALGIPVRNHATLYRLLDAAQHDGLVSSRWVTDDEGRGPARRLYSLTPCGDRRLREGLDCLAKLALLVRRLEGRYHRFA